MMASAGPKLGGVATNSVSGTYTWVSPTNVLAEDGSNTSFFQEGAASAVSKVLLVTDFDFAADIPAGATIDGIVVTLGNRTQQGAQGATADSVVRLLIGGEAAGDNKAAGGNWPIGDPSNATYGAADDTWGLTPTAEQINAEGFGVGVAVTFSSGPAGAGVQIDFITITVHFTEAEPEPEAAGGANPTQTSGLGLGYD